LLADKYFVERLIISTKVKQVFMLKLLQTTGLHSYKTYGRMKDIDTEVCAKVFMDLDYRKIWDGYVKGM